MISDAEREELRKLATEHIDAAMAALRARRQEILAETKAEQGAIGAMMRAWLLALEVQLKDGDRPDLAELRARADELVATAFVPRQLR